MLAKQFTVGGYFATLLVHSISFTCLSGTREGVAQERHAWEKSIASIRSVGKEGAGFELAMVAAATLRRTPVSQVTVLLDGMADTSPVAENWMRGIVFDVMRNAKAIPLNTLMSYAMDRSRNAKGRGLAMEIVRNEAPEKAAELIRECLNDPGLPLREMAVQQAIDKAEGNASEDAEAAKALYHLALEAARHPTQLERIVEALRKLGDQDVSIATSFGMIGVWTGLAPLDNVDGVGYDAVYQPEADFVSHGSVDLEARYDGKHGEIQWKPVGGSEDTGQVDLAVAYNKEKGAVCYLYTEFDASRNQPAQVRLASKNANKVWVNGKPVMANEVYHSGSTMDQYIGDCQLQQGRNRILLKICQNEQTESWAQDWAIQFRVTDLTGKAIHSGK